MTPERRAAHRFLFHSPIEITGIEVSGLQFAERAHVEDVSDLGCRFTLKTIVLPGGVIGIEPLGPEDEKLGDDFPRLFVIRWVKPMGDRIAVGARCLLEPELRDVCLDAKFLSVKYPIK